MVAAGRIDVVVGDMVIEAETVPVTGTQQTLGRTGKAAENVADAFHRAQDAIIEVARLTAAMIDRAGAAARPDRVAVEFGLGFTAAGGVIMAGVAGQASLKVTLSWEAGPRSAEYGASEPEPPVTGSSR